MIPFFKKTTLPQEIEALDLWYCDFSNARQSIQEYFKTAFSLENFLPTKSCTQSLEIALMAIEKNGRDEIILPSYAFVSLANAIVLNGFKCVFVDCEPSTMNIDANAVEQAITAKTAAIITINYGGVACDYDRIRALCQKHGLFLLEDNAHGIRCQYKGKWLGAFGDISTISFDYLKNVSCNEGGGIAVNNLAYLSGIEQAYHFGTNRASFVRGEAAFYEWKGVGANAAMAEQLAVILFEQLKHSEQIVARFKSLWNLYYQLLGELQENGSIGLPKIPECCITNGHMFWIKAADAAERAQLISYLAGMGIQAAFHYTALHNSEFGRKAGVFSGEDIHTSRESQRLLRLPLYHDLTEDEVAIVTNAVKDFYLKRQSS